MTEVDKAIREVEKLYRAVTGNDVPALESPYAAIPAEQDPATYVKHQLDRLLAALAEPASQMALQANAHARPWSPPVSLCESSTDFVVSVDLPGVGRERIQVRVEGGYLIVTGQRPAAINNARREQFFAEQPYGSFHRTVALPSGLKTSEMTAQLKDGVLGVRIPRNGDASARTVPVA